MADAHIQSKETPTNVWAQESAQALLLLETTMEGLSPVEVERRQRRDGSNELRTKRSIGPVKIFLHQFQSPLIFLLIGAAVLSVVLNEWIDAGVILLAIGVNAILGFYQEYHAESTLQKLKSYIKERTRVIRAGVEQEVDATELVVGDIINLSYGARVPADARLLSVNNLRVDEAILTGESLPVSKEETVVAQSAALVERTNMVYAGTLITEGYALAVVAATGRYTELGKIAQLVVETKRVATPLQRALERFGWTVFGVVMVVVAGIFILGLMRGEPILEMLLLSAAVSVGAIPEALPVALTVILAIGVERLAVRKGVMRTLAGAETLGSTTLILTDKTGTLTEAQMKLVGIVTIEQMSGTSGEILVDGEIPVQIGAEQKEILTLALSNIDVIEESMPGQASRFIGKPLEANIALAARHFGIELKTVGKELLLPFNSTNKFSVAKNFAVNKTVVLGAPDILLARSTLTKDARMHAEGVVELLSAQGSRLVGIAVVPANAPAAAKINKKQLVPADVTGIEFVGLLILRDPVRQEVPDAIKRIESHGVQLAMVTGDLKGTALAVSRELGWHVPETAVLTGAELRELSDEALLAKLPTTKIFARVTPEDKLRIGLLYKRLGYVVAMTGDGVNDAPSLKAVDIGIALGSGSDVAKATAELVLLDDNFKTIVGAIDEGRRILANIRKVFVYLMSNSLDEIILIGGCLLLNLPLPLTALQIIWVNFFTGSLPALAFAFDENHDTTRAGRKSVTSIFNKEVTILTAGVGVLTSALLLILYVGLIYSGLRFEEAQSILFACFATYILVVAFSFRSLQKPLWSYPVFSNKYLTVGVIVGALLFALTMGIAPVRELFGLVALPTLGWIILPLWLVGNVLLVEGAKSLFRRYI